MEQVDLDIARLVDRLLRHIHGGLNAKAPEFDTHDVGQAGGLLLLTVADLEPVSSAALVETLARDKSQVARMIAALERKGLVERTPHPSDARSSLLALSATGRDAVCEIRVATAKVISHILAPLSDAEKDTLRGLLGQV